MPREAHKYPDPTPQLQGANNVVQVGLDVEPSEKHDDRAVANATIRPLVESAPKGLPARCDQNGSVSTSLGQSNSPIEVSSA